ncbi:hypothetical protein OJP00_02145 [Campylobacter lari]|uniref:hypothetical protein n=1 Tax=Campylobacter lari TaxID=201 RepID=UPI0021F6E14F|nr:hypothetical protein [Campylobacter lari]MCW0185371.1 hypothetical protein [Campylobacter lari]
MKLSYYTSKVLMGVSISALLSSAALAQEINHGNFSDFFNYKDGIWSLDSKENIELKISPSDIQSYYGGENHDKPIKMNLTSKQVAF